MKYINGLNLFLCIGMIYMIIDTEIKGALIYLLMLLLCIGTRYFGDKYHEYKK